MKKINLITLILLGGLLSCSSPNDPFIEKIKQQVKEDALGVEMNYKNIEFKWVDTLFVSEKLNPLRADFNTRIQKITDIEYFVKDNFKKGKVFSKSYLTKDRFLELRNWEVKVGHPNKNPYGGGQAIWIKDGYKDYYEYAFANRTASKWITELCEQIERTDALAKNYDSIEEGDLQLMDNVLWFYTRIDNYESSKNPDQLWTAVGNEIAQLKQIKGQIDSLSTLDPNKIIFYKTLNTYKINNPLLNGVEQEMRKYFLFDESLNIIGKEDYVK
jgi:hypothetical protein